MYMYMYCLSQWALARESTVFIFVDNGHSFENVLLYGHEATLLIFDMLFFAIVDLIFQDFILAAIVVYIADEVSRHLCLHFHVTWCFVYVFAQFFAGDFGREEWFWPEKFGQ